MKLKHLFHLLLDWQVSKNRKKPQKKKKHPRDLNLQPFGPHMKTLFRPWTGFESSWMFPSNTKHCRHLLFMPCSSSSVINPLVWQQPCYIPRVWMSLTGLYGIHSLLSMWWSHFWEGGIKCHSVSWPGPTSPHRITPTCDPDPRESVHTTQRKRHFNARVTGQPVHSVALIICTRADSVTKKDTVCVLALK